MSRHTDVKIFIASSGELKTERDQSVIAITELNKRYKHLHLEPVLFEIDTPSGNFPWKERIQDGINPKLVEAHVAIVIFYSKAGEFTLEELQLAAEQNKKVFVLFKNGFEPENSVQLEGYGAVLKLREKLESEGKIRYNTYKTTSEYYSTLYKELGKYIDATYPNAPAKNAEEGLPPESTPEKDPIPTPPELYAEPSYIGSHGFVGRRAQLDALDDWANAADPSTVLLFDAIGGSGKSMLTWHWVNDYAWGVRQDWAGVFWYSFYEKGTTMADFCRYALAYMTGQPLEELKKTKMARLKEQLLHQLKSKPWLFVLDGLERVMVAYNRIDAAELPDEALDTPTDEIARRNPTACINDDDDELLRALAGAAPSKILVSSRLVPRVLLNNANQPIPGVLRVVLPGLRPAEAEALFRNCGIRGDAQIIQNYLVTNCGCHPLTIGVLAGLVNDYMPDKGNFDKWLADPDWGGKLNMAELDLVQRRNHILQAALNALPSPSKQLLNTIALLSEAVDYDTLLAFNLHMQPEPEEVVIPEEQEDVQKELVKTIKDLEERGLLQYDLNEKRYDLHPVVRGVASGNLKTDEKEKYGLIVVDHFTAIAHNPYEEATTYEDIRTGVETIRVLLKMGHYQQAFDLLSGDLIGAIVFNLHSHKLLLALYKPFFLDGWDHPPIGLKEYYVNSTINNVAVALAEIKQYDLCLKLFSTLIMSDIQEGNTIGLSLRIRNTAFALNEQLQLTSSCRVRGIAMKLSQYSTDEDRFMSRLHMFIAMVSVGEFSSAEELWQQLDPMGRNWHRAVYRQGDAEMRYVYYLLYTDRLSEKELSHARELCEQGRNLAGLKQIQRLKGEWHVRKQKWRPAAESFKEAIRMAHESDNDDSWSEVWLALCKFHLGELQDPVAVIDKLSDTKKPKHYPLAELYLAIGETEKAKKHALKAYERYWADGEPYVFRYYLDKTKDLLQRLEVDIPDLPPYDPTKEVKFDWEEKVEAFIKELEQKQKDRKEKRR